MSVNFTVKFTDGVTGNVSAVKITDTYEGYLELSSFSAVTENFLSEYEERKALIEAGRLKGNYCFEPELIDEVRREIVWTEKGGEWKIDVIGRCFKDNKISAQICFYEGGEEYQIELEWYQSTQELSKTPITILVQQRAGILKFEDIKKCCNVYE